MGRTDAASGPRIAIADSATAPVTAAAAAPHGGAPPAGQSAHADNVKGLDWVREQAVEEGGSERPRRTDGHALLLPSVFLLLLAQPRRRWEEETGTSKGGGQQDDAREGRRRGVGSLDSDVSVSASASAHPRISSSLGF